MNVPLHRTLRPSERSDSLDAGLSHLGVAMKKTVQLLDDVKAKLGLPSDYAAAKALDVTRSTVSAWRNGKATFDEDSCFRVAEILGLSPFEIITAVNVERARDERHRLMWSTAWENFSKGFRSLVLRANACGAFVLQV